VLRAMMVRSWTPARKRAQERQNRIERPFGAGKSGWKSQSILTRRERASQDRLDDRENRGAAQNPPDRVPLRMRIGNGRGDRVPPGRKTDDKASRGNAEGGDVGAMEKG
jgi:hypothetical protein